MPATPTDPTDDALAQARSLASMLSTPKLAAGLGAMLAGQGAPEDPSVRGPLRALRWLGPDGEVDQEALRGIAARLTELRGDRAVLQVRRVESMPATHAERTALSARIVRLAWERLGSPRVITEPELTAALAMLASDPALVRRDAVDAGMLLRSDDGARYELVDGSPA